MRNNPCDDWSIDDLETLAARNGIDWRQPGTGHVTVSNPGFTPLTVPGHKPIKAENIKRFLELIDRARKDDEN